MRAALSPTLNQNPLFWILVLFSAIRGYCQTDTSARQHPINDDPYLHSADVVTPYTLRKREWIYGQSVQTLPFPSWGFVGVTDKLTAQLDFLPYIFGVFTELKKPIPSLNFRYRFNEQKGLIPTIGAEAMFVHFWDTIKRATPKVIDVHQSGSYFHFKAAASYKVKEWYFNFSVGADYIAAMTMENPDTLNHQWVGFAKAWNPNMAIGVDYRPSNWISYHVGYTYGATLMFVENIPRKQQFIYSFRIAPFYKNRHGFLRNFRFELLSINVWFPDVDVKQTLPIPIYPYLYWQWRKKTE